MHDQKWVELADITKRSMDTQAWITLRATKFTRTKGHRFAEGHQEDNLMVATASFPVDQADHVKKAVSWKNLNLNNDHAPYVQDGQYRPADIFDVEEDGLLGTKLVLSQRTNKLECNEWHVHSDLVLGLGLKREDDVWVAMDEGYIPVVRLLRNDDGTPNLLEIRASHLKDFLSARREFLCVSSYIDRELIVDDASFLTWDSKTQ